MELSKQELLREALETGFRPEIMEKVWYLMAILTEYIRNIHIEFCSSRDRFNNLPC